MDGFKFCEVCNDQTIHASDTCVICEAKRSTAAKFFNTFDFNKCDRATLKGIKHVIQTGGLSFD